MDQECADGLFNWTYSGNSIPDWSINQELPFYVKSSVSYRNDSNNHFSGSLLDVDEKSLGTWFGIGMRHTTLNEDGTDRIFTNDNNIWTSRAWKGDRYDAWNIGYNEIFSPYSSPSTNSWDNANTGIFIWYYNFTGSTPTDLAYFKIYKAGVNETISLDSALHLTPPSRPMGLVVVPCDSQPTINGYKRIKLRWNHNMEPDMRRSIGGEGLAKRYRIYRSTASDMGSVPPDALAYSENFYDCIDTVDINENSRAEYIDDELVSICNTEACAPPNYCIEFPVRYRVQAVDKYDDVSVLSDFANTRAGSLEAGIGGDNLLTGNDSELPNTYSLSQNYPNPFNPVTNIRYDLPYDNYVTIKVYDVLGKEVVTLVNEYKEAGRYLVSFNAANFSSGIYFYTIQVGEFSQTRRMTVLK